MRKLFLALIVTLVLLSSVALSRTCGYYDCDCYDDCYYDCGYCDVNIDVSTPSLYPDHVDECDDRTIRAKVNVRLSGGSSREIVNVKLYVYRSSSRSNLVLTRSETINMRNGESDWVTFYFDSDDLSDGNYYVYARAEVDGCDHDTDWSSYSRLYVDGCGCHDCDYDCYDPCDYDYCDYDGYDDCYPYYRTGYHVNPRYDYEHHYEPPRTILVTTVSEAATTTLTTKPTGYIVRERGNEMDDIAFWGLAIVLLLLVAVVAGMALNSGRFRRTRVEV